MVGIASLPSSTPAVRTVALIGNPNTGKSSLFNALCGMNARVGNYPGVTVEQKVGRLLGSKLSVEVIDLPGTYSLAARSADEAVAVQVLTGTFPNQAKPQIAVVILDAANVERNLYLFSQVVELGVPVLVVLNMWDRVESEGIQVNPDLLSKRLGVPVVCTSANKRKGIEHVRETIEAMLLSPSSAIAPERLARAQFPEAFHIEAKNLSEWLTAQNKSSLSFQVDRLLIDTDSEYQRNLCQSGLHAINDRITDARNRMGEAGCKVPMFETKTRYAWIRQIIEGAVTRRESKAASWSDQVDRWLTHRWIGMFVFVLIMFLVFQSITFFAEWPMQGIEAIQGWISGGVESVLPPGAFRSLLADGVVAGVGGVLMFLPQIAILFFFIAVLEYCGYMARAAVVMDKLMSSVGLSGKSFLPLMSSFACAIPGIMATRTIENRKDRMVTLLVAPLMSCSARMPVYILMVSAFVPATTYAAGWISLQGLVLLGMQSIGAIVAVPVAWFLKKFFFPGETATFLMELHSYKWPSFFVVSQRVWERVLAFVTRAGTLIFCTTILVWAAGYFPSDHQALDKASTNLANLQAEWDSLAESKASMTTEPDPADSGVLDVQDAPNPRIDDLKQSLDAETDRVNQLRSGLIENSFLGMAGKVIEPTVKPLGWDWKIGVAVIASFPAREVIISTLGTIYSLGAAEDHESQGLQSQMRGEKWPDGKPVFTLATAMSIMIFFALCAQCSATLMTIRRETNSWRWPIFSFVYMTTLAYIGAWVAFKIFS